MRQVRHGSATTTHAVRAEIQRSIDSLTQMSRELGINPMTVAKRAEKAGKPLPDTLVTRVRLGSAGKIQLKATHVERRPEKVFRMPHIRGTGPVIPQARRVELPGIADQLATKERLAITGEAE